jgi:integrase
LASEGFYTLGGFLFLMGIQELLGHKDEKTTMVYTYVLNQAPKGVRSPKDAVAM